MLYQILKFLMKITVSVFFRSISIRNKNLIPKEGPLMIVANHPSTFMDPIVIATMLDRKLYFLAKGALFKSKIAKWLLPKFNMIPVYRKQDDPSQMTKNEESFEKCYEYLEQGCAILIFPEGTSITERKLRPIKSGAARIVLGAEQKNNFELGIKVITIGLNYTNPHRFNKDLFINIDLPIDTKDFKQEYILDSFKGSKSLTETIRAKLEKLIIDIQDSNTDKLVANIELLYKYKLEAENGIKITDMEDSFNLTKNIVASVNHYVETDPARAKNMEFRISEFLNNLKTIDLKDEYLEEIKSTKSLTFNAIKSIIISIIGLPFYLFGLINNYLPFEIPGWIARKTSKTPEFIGAIGMVGGMFTFLIFYTIQILLVWKFTSSSLFTFLYALSLPITGLFAYWYYYTILKIKARWTMVNLFLTRSVLISNLIYEREQIIIELDKAKEDYLKFKAG